MKRTIFTLLCLLSLHIAKGDEWCAGTEVTTEEIATYGIENLFCAEPISDAVFARMQGKSYKADCTIPRSELRYIKALHITLDGVVRRGEMVVNRAISDDIVAILVSAVKAASNCSTCGGGIYILNSEGQEVEFKF